MPQETPKERATVTTTKRSEKTASLMSQVTQAVREGNQELIYFLGLTLEQIGEDNLTSVIESKLQGDRDIRRKAATILREQQQKRDAAVSLPNRTNKQVRPEQSNRTTTSNKESVVPPRVEIRVNGEVCDISDADGLTRLTKFIMGELKDKATTDMIVRGIVQATKNSQSANARLTTFVHEHAGNGSDGHFRFGDYRVHLNITYGEGKTIRAIDVVEAHHRGASYRISPRSKARK